MTPHPIRTAVALTMLLLAGACAPPPGGGAWRGSAAPAVAPLSGPVELVPITADNAADFAAPVTATAAPPGGDYRAGRGDVLQLQVVDAPELTLPAGYRVGSDGAIEVPYLGRVPAADRTTEEIRRDLVARLRPYIARPQVDVRVTGFHARHVAVVGEVRQPNRQPLTDRPLTVIDAINAAGGFADLARRPAVALIRNGVPQAVDIDGFLTAGRPLPALQDGDVVVVGAGAAGAARAAPVPAAPPVLLVGPAGTRLLDPAGGLTLAQAAGAAGLGRGDTAYVLRATPTGVRALVVEGAAAFDPAIGGRLTLISGDRVVAAVGTTADPARHLARIAPGLSATGGL